MKTFVERLEEDKDQVLRIIDQIENKDPYMEDMRGYLTSLNEMTKEIIRLTDDPQIALDLNIQFYLQVLNDIMYGIENEDSVFLLDVLQYGLLEIYNYIETELQGRMQYE